MTMLHIRRIAAAGALVAVVFASKERGASTGGVTGGADCSKGDLPCKGAKGEGARAPGLDLPATKGDNSAQGPTMMEGNRGPANPNDATSGRENPMSKKCGTLAENEMCYNFVEGGIANLDCRGACEEGLMCYGGPRRRDLDGKGGLSTDPGAGTSTGYEEGQQRCCARKVDGCECLSSKEGSCSPECDHILKPDNQCSQSASSCNTEAMKTKIIKCWAAGGAAKCVHEAGWMFEEKLPKHIGTMYCKPKPDGMTGGTGGTTKPGGNSELTCPHEKGSLAKEEMCYKFEEAAKEGNFDCKKHCGKGLRCAPKMDAIGFNSYMYCLPLGGGPTGTGESDALGDIGDKCTSQAGCQKGLFCKKTKAGATCADRCEKMRCANCKRGVCGSQCPCGERCDLGTRPGGKPSMGAEGKPTFRPSLGICMENGECSAVKRQPVCAKPECPEPEECDAVFPCSCAKEKGRDGCTVSALKCPEAPEGCAAYSIDGCNWCRVTEDGQINPELCTKRMCAQDKDDFCSLVGAKRPGCKKCNKDWVLIKGKCYMKDDSTAPLPPLELDQVCYKFDETDAANNVDRKNDCPPCSKCVREPAAGVTTGGDAVYKCRALGKQKLEEKCNTENACAPGLHCEARDARRAARNLGKEDGLSTDPGAGTSTGYEEGQQRCCARKADGCECLSSKEGSCSPECDDILKPDNQCSKSASSCNTEAMKTKIVGCWADGGAAECVKAAGWMFDAKVKPGPGLEVKPKPGPGLALNKCRRVCEKNGARTMMVADGKGGCKCPSFLTMVNSGTVAKEGEMCTGSLWTELKSLKAASMAKNQCAGMICKPKADSDELVHMVRGAQGCSCPAEDAMDTWERARFCGKGLTCGSAGDGGQRKCEAVQLDDGDCDAEVGCGGAGKCIAAPKTGFEIVSGMGKCIDKPEVSQAAPGICKDYCEQMKCPGKCSMGVCSAWKAETAIKMKPAEKKCNKDAGEIAVNEGFRWTCTKAAKKAMTIRFKTKKGSSIKDLTVEEELETRDQIKQGVIRSNADKGMKMADILDLNLADGASGKRRAENTIVATLAFAPQVAVADLKYSDEVKLSDDKVLQVESTGTVQTEEAFTPAPGSQPTNEPTSAPTGLPPAGNVGGSDTTASPPTTTEAFPTEESAATTAVATATLLGLSALWW